MVGRVLCQGVVAMAVTGAALLGPSQPASAGGMVPVPTSGYNRDIVVERTATKPYSNFAASFDTFNALCFYENGLPDSTQGLPQGGAFTSALDGTTAVQLQPYNAKNVLFLSPKTATTGQLLFHPAAMVPYSQLAVFACSTNGGGQGSLVINFSDGTSSAPMNFNARDWFDNTGAAISGVGRISLANDNVEYNEGNPRIYQTSFDLVALGLNTKAIRSTTFTMPNVGADTTTGVFAVSGLAVATEVRTAARKQGAADRLAPYLPAQDKAINEALTNAVLHIGQSLDPNWWADANHLTMLGSRVFGRERDAAGHLLKLLGDPSLAPLLRVEVQASLDDLGAADEELALTALTEAMAGAGPGKKPQAELAMAGELYKKGLAKLQAGDVTSAIQDFQSSWEHSQKALGNKPR